MEPIRIVAKLAGPLTLRDGQLRIDGLLAWAEADRLGLPPHGFGADQCIEIPIASESGGRFHLCSYACPKFDAHETRYVNQRFPISEAQDLSEPKFKRINIASGPQKSYRIKDSVAWAERDELEWFAVGDADKVRELLSEVLYLGRKRAVGRGKVRAWEVAPCKPWGDGFPVVRDGKALRALPLDWPGLVRPNVSRAVLTYPYFERTREVLCAVPEES